MVVAGVARAAFRVALPTFIRRGMTATAMVEHARVAGYSYRYTNMLRDIREISGFAMHESAIRARVAGEMISKFNMTEIDLKRPRRYRGFADVTYTDRVTGTETYQRISFYDDEQLLDDEWRDKFERERIVSEYKTDQDLTYFEMVALEHNEGWAY